MYVFEKRKKIVTKEIKAIFIIRIDLRASFFHTLLLKKNKYNLVFTKIILGKKNILLRIFLINNLEFSLNYGDQFY